MADYDIGKARTCACHECGEDISAAAWSRYFGRDQMVGAGPSHAFQYHCGCDGVGERMLIVESKPSTGGKNGPQT